MTGILLNKHVNHDNLCDANEGPPQHLAHTSTFTTRVTEHEGETDEYQAPLLQLPAD